MSVKEILLLGDERLYQPSQLVRKDEREEIETLMKDLHDTLMNYKKIFKKGRAIAAPQIGIFKRVIYLIIDKPILMINPKIIYTTNDAITKWDDCICFPNLMVKVNRFKNCRVYYKDLDWNEIEMDFENEKAEIMQHEYDHLDGILATQRAIDNKGIKVAL